jgi:aldose 1-epimerase
MKPMPSTDAYSTVRLANQSGLELTLMTRGATWLSCKVPVKGGGRREVLLGRQHPTEPLACQAYLGATIGRYANRIGHARIVHEGRALLLTPNTGSAHQLHGGPQGFDSRDWTVEAQSDSEVQLSLRSPDGDQGFPGALSVRVTYRLVGDLGIEMVAEATTTKTTPVCLTNHAYFNLDAQPGDVRDHRLQIAAEQFLPVDSDLIPLGTLAPVSGTGFDFRQPKTLRQDWLADAQQAHASGYDHAFLLDSAQQSMERPICVLVASDCDLSMAMFSSLPSLQLYAGQLLAGTPSRDGTPYTPCAGMALEPQFLPDSPNHPEWPQPSCWLQAGQTYRHVIRWIFSTPHHQDA